jgi:hypothetical protein
MRDLGQVQSVLLDLDGPRYQPHTCRSGTITGKITKIFIEKFAEDMEPGIAFTLLTADGNQVHVHVAPLWFMEKRESDLNGPLDNLIKPHRRWRGISSLFISPTLGMVLGN